MNSPLHRFQDQLKTPISPPVFDYLTTDIKENRDLN